MTDWLAWHGPYDDPRSSLSRRLTSVQRSIGSFLDRRPGPVHLISACAGLGQDVAGALTGRLDADRVSGRLVELDPRLSAMGAEAVRPFPSVECICGDAGDLASYDGAVPADLVLLCGVFGNITEADVRTTLDALPRLCASGGEVIWTRGREDTDAVGRIRGWFVACGFGEVSYDAPPDVDYRVGVHRFDGDPAPYATGRLFTFVR